MAHPDAGGGGEIHRQPPPMPSSLAPTKLQRHRQYTMIIKIDDSPYTTHNKQVHDKPMKNVK